MATALLFIAMLIITLMRVVLPRGARIHGHPLRTVALSFRERVLFQRVNLYAIGFVLLLTAATGLVSTGWELLVVVTASGILLLPVRLVLTTEGVATNNVVFRPWEEFLGFTAERRRIRLHARAGTRDLVLPLLPARQGEALAVIQHFLRPSGHPASCVIPVEQPTGGPGARFRALWNRLPRKRLLVGSALVLLLSGAVLFASGGTALARCPEGK
ncbi:MAG TPA: hypothetical protein VNN21_05375, partial [Dehalococcoidia bacterium]|nr:hypothetical protein [Dehalococcoidia bacterium]